MPADFSPPSVFDPSAMGQLACPTCLVALRFDEDTLTRAYPNVDGIPALVAGREVLICSVTMGRQPLMADGSSRQVMDLKVTAASSPPV
ncbi:MAG: hypothetical protein ABSF70_20220 [Terracidiphilus sp.]|jgi:uncharacterized protein YbaR (Trm112 family)